MKKLIFTLLSLVTLISSYAQVTITADTVWYNNFPKDGIAHINSNTIVNNGSSPVTVTWNKTSETLLTGWTAVGICDPIACYQNNSASHSATLNAGQTGTWYVDMKAVSTAADGPCFVTLTTNYGDMTFGFKASPVSVKDFDINNAVSIYPNPASNHINIAVNDKTITNINVVNVIGKKIAKFEVDNTTPNPIHVSIDNIPTGIYLLQFSDNHGKLVGVKRVTKQ